MQFPAVFHPPRRLGIVFNIAAGIILAGAAAASLLAAFSLPIGSTFLLLFLLALLLCAPLGAVIYRLLALFNASYTIDRDGLRLRWGLRAEDIPIHEAEWIRPASELALPLRLPLLGWPGAFLGQASSPDLGPVEFLAAERGRMLLIATPAKIYAISPADVNGFSKAFRRTTELGSLAPLPSYSARPAAYLNHVWNDRAARILFSAGLGLTLLMFVIVSLGFSSALSNSSAPSMQNLLLPFLGSVSFGLNLLLGLAFYRRINRPLAYLLWAGGAAAPLIFSIGILFTA